MSSIIVSSGITSTGGIVSKNEELHISSGGIADSTTVKDLGVMYVSNGGMANSTTVSRGGSMHLNDGGIANSTTILSGGGIDISSNAFGTALSLSAGGVLNGYSFDEDKYFENIVSGSAFLDENVYIYTSRMFINSGGKVNALTAISTNESSLHIKINSAGTLENSTIMGGGISVSSGGTVNNITVKKSKVESNHSYWVGSLNILSGAKANNVTVEEGYILKVSSGGIANSTIMANGGDLVISSGGIANYTAVNWGAIGVHRGGSANSTTLNSGYIDIQAGGDASNTIINGGRLTIHSGGFANSTTVNSGGSIYIASGGLAEELTISAGGNLNGFSFGEDKHIDETYGDAILVSKNVYVSEYIMTITSGGVAENTNVNSGGSMIISSGGTHKGCLGMSAAGIVSAYEGAIIDFTVADRTVEDGYLIDNLSRISGAPTYTLTVSDDQASGTYKLANVASGFDKTVTVKVENKEVGTLTVGGTLTSGDVSYALNLNGSQLTLTVSGAPDTPDEPTYIPVPSSSELIAGTFNGIGGSFELTEDGSGVIHTASDRIELSGTIDTGKWELLGTGDFNKDGNDGLLWLEKETGYVYAQNNLTNFNEVSNKTNCLGVVEEGYEIRGIGDFSGTGIDGVVMKGPAFGDERISLNYGLPVWAREADGTKFDGWLGALVNTWQPGEVLEGDVNDLADINAKNYMYEIVDVGDYNGDGVDDVMLQNIMPTTVDGVTITGSGDVFTFLTGDTEAIKAGEDPTVVYTGCVIEGWEVLGSGDFNGDGTADVLLSDGTGVAGWAMSNGQRTEDQWFGNLSADEKLVGVADVNNDGTDDLLIYNAATEQMSAWLVKDGAATEILAIA